MEAVFVHWHYAEVPSAPEKELYVDHSRSYFLHHVSDEVKLVARAGGM